MRFLIGLYAKSGFIHEECWLKAAGEVAEVEIEDREAVSKVAAGLSLIVS